MRSGYALALVLGGTAALFGLVFDPPDRLIWNRTGSAPQGLFWLSGDPFTRGRWVVVSARSAQAEWAEAEGFVGTDWPLLKQVAGVPGDEICREGSVVLINGKHAAIAREVDSRGRFLPVWQGCLRLGGGEFFLLAPHPDSLDGRYFGVTDVEDLDGVARPLITFGN
ncbi:MAG: S26 family signal peptidase [Hyphomonas sp.]